MLRKEREREIKQLAVHNQQRQCELSAYQHAVLPIDVVLKKNTDFKDAPPFQLVRAAIQRLLDLNQQKNEQHENDTTATASNPESAHPADTSAGSPVLDRPNSL